MKKFVSIGHWDFNKHHVTCVAGDSSNRAEFESDLKANGFVSYMVFSEQRIAKYKAADIFGRMDMISSRNRHALAVESYLNECMDIIEKKLAGKMI